MLSHKILTRDDVGRAASYYEDSADDYYAKEGDASQWQGKGAQLLGLAGAVDSAKLRQLMAGEVQPGVYATRSATRDDNKTRIGIDFTFSAPKSVSIQALVAGDAEIVKAHDRAVQRAMEAAEERAQARKKIDGRSQIETTGNLVIAKFRHETSREKDPHLHTHAVVMNLTRRSDGEWRALKNDEIVKMTRYLGAVYRAELAAELQQLGYQVRHERDGMFELAHIDRKQLEGFSQRSAQIEQRLEAMGLSRETASTEQKQQATMQSRARKVKTEREALFDDWKSRARDLGIDFERREWAGAERDGPHIDRQSVPTFAPADEAAKRAVRYAINHLTERQSVMTERALLDTAMKHSVGAARLRDIEAAMQKEVQSGYLVREQPLYRTADAGSADAGKTRDAWVAELVGKGLDKAGARERVEAAIERGGLVAVDVRYTTQTAMEREKRILQIERDGRGQLAPILSAEAAAERFAGTTLNAGQREAATLMLASSNRVVGVQGFAGTGKSHMLGTAKAAIEERDFEVRALAPYGSQVKALRELGIEANTLASFLRAKEKNIGPRTVLVIDEAGTVPTRLMEQTLKLAEKSGARVVLMGDTAQTKAIEAGRPFDQLQAAGMETARMTEIQRQKDPELKAAVELAARGESRASLNRIREVTEIADHHDRRATIAAAYLQLAPEDREKSIIVSGTNDARREINAMVREGIGTAGKGIEFDTLIRRDTTQAERRFSKNYRLGDVIQPEKDYPGSGLKRGELYRVTDTGPGNRLTVRAADGQQIEFSPMTHRKLSVYQPERAELAPGDVVRVTRNDAQLDLANGDRFKIERVTPGRVALTDGKRQVELATDKPLHLDHAYATTVHSSQGLTADRVLIDANSRSLTTAKDVYYVAISRARHEARIYTDDAKQLPAAIARENVKLAALDLAHGRRDHQAERHSHERQNAGGAQRAPQLARATPARAGRDRDGMELRGER